MNFFNMKAQNFAAIIFIGGDGVRNYWNNSIIHKIALEFEKANKIIGAICRAPVILAKAGLLSERKATCFPANKNEIEKLNVIYMDSEVVVSGNIITAQSPIASSEFANVIVSHLSK